MPEKIITIGRLKEIIGDQYASIIPIYAPYTNDLTYCPTYGQLTDNKTICPKGSDTSAGVMVTAYSVGDSSVSYASNQLVCECDIKLVTTMPLTIQGNIQGYKVEVKSADGTTYSSAVTASSTAVTFQLVPSEYNYTISRGNDYTIKVSPSADTIAYDVLTYTPSVSAMTTAYTTLNDAFTMTTAPKTISVTTVATPTTSTTNYTLAITEGSSYGSVNTRTINYSAANISVTDPKVIKYKVTHGNSTAVTANGQVSQNVVPEYTLTINSNARNGEVVVSNSTYTRTATLSNATNATASVKIPYGSYTIKVTKNEYPTNVYVRELSVNPSTITLKGSAPTKDATVSAFSSTTSWDTSATSSHTFTSSATAKTVNLASSTETSTNLPSVTATRSSSISGYTTASTVASNGNYSITETTLVDASGKVTFTAPDYTSCELAVNLNAREATSAVLKSASLSYSPIIAVTGGTSSPTTACTWTVTYDNGDVEDHAGYVVSYTTANTSSFYSGITSSGVVGAKTKGKSNVGTTNTKVADITVTYGCSEISTSTTKSAIVYQRPNTTTTAATPSSASISYAVVAASGGTVTPSSYSPNSVVFTRTYATGLEDESTVYPTFSVSSTGGTYQGFTASTASVKVGSKGTTPSSSGSIATVTSTYVNPYGSDVTASTQVIQEANAVVSSSSTKSLYLTIDDVTSKTFTNDGGSGTLKLVRYYDEIYTSKSPKEVSVVVAISNNAVTLNESLQSNVSVNKSTSVVTVGTNPTTSDLESTISATYDGVTSNDVVIDQTALPQYDFTVYSNSGGTVTVSGYGDKTLNGSGTNYSATYKITSGDTVSVSRSGVATKYGTTQYDYDVAPNSLSWTSAQTSVGKSVTVSTFSKTPSTSYTTASTSITVNSITSVTVNVTSATSAGDWAKTSGAKVTPSNVSPFSVSPSTASSEATFTVTSPSSASENGYSDTLSFTVDGYSNTDGSDVTVSLSMDGTGKTYYSLTVYSNYSGTAYATWGGTQHSGTLTGSGSNYSYTFTGIEAGTYVSNITRSSKADTFSGTTTQSEAVARKYQLTPTASTLSWGSSETSIGKDVTVQPQYADGTHSRTVSAWTTYSLSSTPDSVTMDGNKTSTQNLTTGSTTSASTWGTATYGSWQNAPNVSLSVSSASPWTSSRNGYTVTYTSPSTESTSARSTTSTISNSTYGSCTVGLSMTAKALPQIVCYRVNIDEETYPNVPANGGTAIISLTLSVYAVYDNGNEVKVTSGYPTIKKSFSKASGVGTVDPSTGAVTFPANTSTTQQQCEVDIEVWCDGYYTCGKGNSSEYATQDGQSGPVLTCIETRNLRVTYPKVGFTGGTSEPNVTFDFYEVYSDKSSKKISTSNNVIVYTKLSGNGAVSSNGDVTYSRNSDIQTLITRVEVTVYHKDYQSCGAKTLTATCEQDFESVNITLTAKFNSSNNWGLSGGVWIKQDDDKLIVYNAATGGEEEVELAFQHIDNGQVLCNQQFPIGSYILRYQSSEYCVATNGMTEVSAYHSLSNSGRGVTSAYMNYS